MLCKFYSNSDTMIVSLRLLSWLNHKESSCNAGDSGSIPGLGRSPGEGNGHPLQYSCLGNPMDRGTWQAVVHGVTEVDTTERLTLHCFSNLRRFSHFSISSSITETVLGEAWRQWPCSPSPHTSQTRPSSLFPSSSVPSCPFAGGAGRSVWEPAA